MKVLLAVGCNHFDHATQLTGAEKDAERIFNALINPDIGQYDPKLSRLVLSPTLEQMRENIKLVLFNSGSIGTFTFFFAGHGGVSAGSFYMWVRDSRPNAQSMTALSLADMFRSLNESSPRQSNIIIDACESGGLITDLGVLLKPDLLGDVGTPALTLVATSSQNQPAGETINGGLGTNAILDCMEGRSFVQDSTPVLDLVEIGRHISTRLKEQNQNPIVWGLNLYGPPSFCLNPKFNKDPAAPLRDVIQTWPTDSDKIVKENYSALWSAYTSLSDNWVIDDFLRIVRTILTPTIHAPRILANQASRIAATFSLKALNSRDPFRLPQVAACIATCLLPYIESRPVAEVVEALMEQCRAGLAVANKQLITNLLVSKYALLSDGDGGFFDLYQLPIKISRVLGWASVAIELCSTPEQKGHAREQFEFLLRFIVDNLGTSIIAISDAQAPFWAVALSTAVSIGLEEEAELLASHIFHSLIVCNGQVSHWDIAPDQVLRYLLARSKNDFSKCADLVERPIETLTVILKAGNLLNLNEIFDESLWKIDGLGLSAYFPVNYLEFGAPTMESGNYCFWEIGHDIFRILDLQENWPSAESKPQNLLIEKTVLCASLLLQDRVPWFVFDAPDHSKSAL